MIVRLAARVAELELLESQHARAALCQPIGGAAADAAQSEHDDVVFVHSRQAA